MKNNQLKTTITHPQIPIKKLINHPQLTSKQNHLTNTPHFRTNKINKKLIILTQRTTLIFMITITLLTLVDTHMTDIISAHNYGRIIDFSSVKKK